jgi:hypothetical protein
MALEMFALSQVAALAIASWSALRKQKEEESRRQAAGSRQ